MSSTAECPCEQLAALMDEWGSRGCQLMEPTGEPLDPVKYAKLIGPQQGQSRFEWIVDQIVEEAVRRKILALAGMGDHGDRQRAILRIPVTKFVRIAIKKAQRHEPSTSGVA